MNNLKEFILRGIEFHIFLLLFIIIYWCLIFWLLNKLKKEKILYVIYLSIYLFIYLYTYYDLFQSEDRNGKLDGAGIFFGFIILPILFIYSISLLTYLLVCWWKQNKRKEKEDDKIKSEDFPSKKKG